MAHALPDFDLDSFLPYRLTVVAAQLSAGLARDYKEKFGISIAEWRVLLNVAYSGKVSIRDIEKRTNLEKSKVSRAASRLAQKGYISKVVSTDDRRLLDLGVTEKGADLLSELIPLAVAFQEKLEQKISAQLPELNAAMDIIIQENDGASN